MSTRERKRDNGSGSVFCRASNGRWYASFTDPITGKRRTVTVASEKAGRDKLREMASRADSGEVVLDARTPLRVYVTEWLANRAGKRRSPATVGEYQYRLERWVIPTLGDSRLGEVTVTDVEDLLDDLAAGGLSTSSLKGVRNALAAVLTDAIRARHLRSGNAARLAVLPDTATRPVRVVPPTTAQVRELLADTHGTELGRVLAVLAATGARIGELLAARWDDLDLEAGEWVVSRTVTRDERRRVTVGDRTKSGNVRTILLGPATVEVLREQRRVVAERQLAAVAWVDDRGFVFPSEVGTPVDPRNLRKELRPVAERVGFPGSFHQLRHYAASVGLSVTAGNDAAVARMLGHARTATTRDVYGHLLAEDEVAITAALEAHLAG